MKRVALKRVVHIVAGQSPPSDEVSDLDGPGLPFLQGNAEFGQSHPSARHQCETPPKRARAGDILLSVRAPVGALNMADRDYGVGRGLAAIRPAGIDSRFAWWSLHAGVDRLRATATGSTFEAITAEDIGSLIVQLPSPSDQRRIADFLDAETARIDALIEKKRRMIALMEERRFAVTDDAVLRNEAPARPVAALADYINGWPFAPGDFTSDGLPVIRIAQLTDPGLEPDLYNGSLPDRVVLRNGDIVFSWSGSLEVRVWDRGLAYLNQHLFRVIPRPGIRADWLRFALDASTRLFRGLMHGSAMTHITQPMMKLVRIPVPSEERQAEVALRLSEIWANLDLLERMLTKQIDLLREHRQTLITAAVTGQLDVRAVA